MPNEPMPRFDGKASTPATFLSNFGYAILYHDGAKHLQVLEDIHDPETWYDVCVNSGTDIKYHFAGYPGEISTKHEGQADSARHWPGARAKDKLAWHLLVAAPRSA